MSSASHASRWYAHPSGDEQRALLDFESAAPLSPGLKEAAVRERFGVSMARYYQVLFETIDTRPALEHDPLLVRRLQRLRDSRASGRASRGFGMRSH